MWMKKDGLFCSIYQPSDYKTLAVKLNENIKLAIKSAVKDERQPPELANKIIAWMENLADGNEEIADPAAYKERCKLCFETTVVTI